MATAKKTGTTAEAMKAQLVALKKLGLPQNATGGDLSNWKADYATISKIQVSKAPEDDTSWITVHGEGSAKLASLQVRVFTFLAVASYISARVDRGFAYFTWIDANSTTLKKYFSGYTIRLTNQSATIPVLQFTVDDVLALAKILAPICHASVLIEAPRKTSRTVGTKVEEEDVEFFL